jgi:4-aminobutyrate aminotransferase-like enzyme
LPRGGLHNNVIRMSPPLNISKADIGQALKILDKSLSEATA